MATELTQMTSQNRFLFDARRRQVGVTGYVVEATPCTSPTPKSTRSFAIRVSATQLVRAVLEEIRTEGDLRVVAICPFVGAVARVAPRSIGNSSETLTRGATADRDPSRPSARS